jgi:antirestriction protein ArdC
MATATKTRRATAKPKPDRYQEITDRILEAMEDGTLPWRKPWTSAGFARSMSTGKPYRGINIWLLEIAEMVGGYSSPWWGTYNQISERGGQVRKGEKSTKVVFWKRSVKTVKNDATGEDEDRAMFFLNIYSVFNAEQADWPEGSKRPTEPTDERTEVERFEAAETIMRAYLDNGGPSLSYGGDRAYYAPPLDSIRLPEMADFHSSVGYYSTAFHELTHSTGHESRLNRKGAVEHTSFGSEMYSKEELVAELGSAYLLGSAGLDLDHEDGLAASAAYVAGWKSRLVEDPKLIVQAAAQAQKAVDLILGAGADEDEDEDEDEEVS